MDIFCEYIIRRKKTAIDFLISMGGCLAAAFLSLIFLMFNSVLMGFGLFLIVAAWYGAFMLSRSRYIEYEYALTNNEIDIDKISAKSRRKHVFNLNFKEIEICAAVNDTEHQSEFSLKPDKIYDFSGVSQYEKYFVDFIVQGQRMRMLFNPTDKMKESIKIINPGAVFLS